MNILLNSIQESSHLRQIPYPQEKDDDAIMTYFAFRISKLENFETLVVILKIFKIKFPI